MTKEYLLFQNGGMGDFLMALFLAEELHTQGGAERVYIELHRRASFLHGFAEEYPFVSVVEANSRNPFTLILLLKLLGRGVTVLMPPTIGKFPVRVKLFAWLLSRVMRGRLVGFKDSGPLCGLYDATLPYKLDQDFAESMRDVVRALGFTPSGRAPRLTLTPAPGFHERFGLEKGKYVVLHPRGAAARRQLSEEEALEIIRHLLALRPSGRVAVSGAEHERGEIEKLIVRVGEKRIRAVIGANPRELTALIEGAELFVGMDTGTTHLACFLGARVLVIAKNGTANWLPFYHKGATVVFRFEEDEHSSTSEAYMRERQRGRLRPFKDIPTEEINDELDRLLPVSG